jgi:LacI family transcriptional regulator
MTRRPTIVDIANELGISHSTVSRAFTQPRRLRPETVERVRAAAAEMGYVPNRSAKALSTGKPGVIGLIVPDITNPFFPPLIRAAQRAAERQDIAVYVGESDNSQERELALIARLERQVEGFVIASSRLSDEALRGVTERTPSVLVNRDLEGVARILLTAGPALTEVITDYAGRSPGAVRYVGGPHRSWSETERRTAITAACTATGCELTTAFCQLGTYEEARAIGEGILVEPGDLIIGFDDVLAHGLFDALADRGLRVPGDVTIIGCDGALPIQTSPQLPTNKLATATAGRRAVEILLEESDDPVVRKEEGVLTRWPPEG